MKVEIRCKRGKALNKRRVEQSLEDFLENYIIEKIEYGLHTHTVPSEQALYIMNNPTNNIYSNKEKLKELFYNILKRIN